MGLLDKFRQRGEDLSDGDYTARGYEARASEVRKAERKEKIKAGLTAGAKSLKKAGGDTLRGAQKTQGWLQAQHDKNQGGAPARKSSGTRGKKKGPKKKTTKKRAQPRRAPKKESLAESMGLGGMGGASQGGDLSGGFGVNLQKSKRKRGPPGMDLL